MRVLVTAAVAGGIVTIISLWTYGVFIAIACAPLGGSFLAVIAATIFSLTRRGAKRRQ